MSQPVPLTVKQAAKILGVSETTVYALCAAGEIRARRVGLKRGTIRIDAADLEDYRNRAVLIQLPSVERRSSPRPSHGLTLLRAGGYTRRG